MMSKKRFSLLLAVLSLFVLVFSSFAVACGDKDNDGDGEVTFTFEVAETVDLPYYEYYEIPEIVATDSNGNLYFTTVKVTNDNGKTIDVEQGKFFVLYTDNYYIEYSTVYNEESVSKTCTGIVKDLTAPELILEKTELGCFVGEKVTVPEFTFGDNFDKEEDLTVSIKVYLDDEEITLTNGEFTPAESGVYEIKYSVTDKAGNVTIESASVAAADREEGNIAYFNNDMATALTGVKANLSSTLSGRGTGDKASPMGGSSTGLSFSNAASPYGGRIDVTRPAITDVSNYQYIYYWVYTPYAGGVTLAYNNVFRGALSNIKPNVWTRIAFENGADGNFYLPATDSKEDGATTMLFGQAADATDIANMLTEYTGLIISITPTAITSDVIDVYFGGFYAANELPELPQGTVAWMPSPVIEVTGIKSMALKDSSIIPATTVKYASGATVKTFVSKDGAERQEVTTASYTFADYGVYTFYFEAYEGNVLVATAERKVTVIQPEEGNIAYFNNENWQVMVDGTIGGDSHLGGRGTGALASPEGGTSTGAYFWTGENYYKVGRIELGAPAITDVSNYKYIYLWVYTDTLDGVYMIYNNVWRGAKQKIEYGVWTRIVFEKGSDGNFYAIATDETESGASTRLFDSVSSGVRPSDISGFMIAWQPVRYEGNVTISISLGGLYAVNELPALPQGTKDWTPMPRMDVSGITTVGYTGDVITPNVNLQYANGATVKKYVSINGGERQEITTSTYTYAVAGSYEFTFEAIIGTNIVASVKKAVTVTEKAQQMVFTIVDFTDPDAITNYGLEGGWGSTLTSVSTTVSPAGGSNTLHANVSTYGGVLISSPAITDLSEYNYIFVDVLNYWGDGKFSFSHLGDRCPQITIAGNQTWTRVVAVNDGNGNFYIAGNESLGTIHVNSSSVTSYSMFFEGATDFYLGMFAACNELPELPQGFVTNYTASK